LGVVKEASVFFFLKKKEAKKTSFTGLAPGLPARVPVIKVFWFFFSKKNRLLPFFGGFASWRVPWSGSA
jgi:hypothetical protein